eukprot:c1391_g1_i1.p1 GENE.c1391_g1_i1~~c1391_g1_i1.p1  ORF type:complete len:313 (+),score=58.80 c1391_g1_i1:25-963(+)
MAVLLLLLAVGNTCNEKTNCGDCFKEDLCVWCSREYYSPPGSKSGCHVQGSLFGCFPEDRVCPVIYASFSQTPSKSSTISKSPSLPSPSRPLVSPDPSQSSILSRSPTRSTHISPSASPPPTTPPPTRSPLASPPASLSSAPSSAPSVSPFSSSPATPSTPPSTPSSSATFPATIPSKTPSTSQTQSSLPPPPPPHCEAGFRWTYCSATHPGCSRDAFPIDVSEHGSTVDQDSRRLTRAECLGPDLFHWLCCIGVRIEEPKALPAQPQQNAVAYALLSLAGVAIGLVVVVERLKPVMFAEPRDSPTTTVVWV